MGTAFENAWINPVMWQAIVGWTGLDQYDEGNPVGQQFLDRFRTTYGRRPEYCVPVVNRDLATVFLHAFADAHPLTPRGVKEALERVKMLPAAAGRRAPTSRSGSGPAGAGWARATWWPGSSIPTASPPASSIASVKTDDRDRPGPPRNGTSNMASVPTEQLPAFEGWSRSRPRCGCAEHPAEAGSPRPGAGPVQRW